ncbi:AAA family ATPase [Oceanobacillus sp. 143]|nr:AAA family ATPase [Oceanobacillus sp. 143]
MSRLKFINATIYGFGKWVDYSIDFTDELAIIYGENESGKSTIQRFILFMFLDYPQSSVLTINQSKVERWVAD